jgi:integrase
MGSRNFYLYPRKNGVLYAQLILPDGRTVWRSTKTKNRDDAAAIVGSWLTEGVPVIKGKVKKPLNEAADYVAVMKFIKNSDIAVEQAIEIATELKKRKLINFSTVSFFQNNQNFIEFLYSFWDHEKSLYLRDKRAHGKNITLRSCIDTKNLIRKNWESYFEEKTLSEITRNELREFGINLKERLAGKTVNNILRVGITALKWAYQEKMIFEDVTAGLGGFIGGEKKRGILTEAEIKKLEDIQYWKDKKSYVAFRLASTSALRNGECLALRREDIGDGILHVRHNYNYIDGLKCPKNGEERLVYILPEVRTLLIELLEENPHKKSPEQFIFYSIVNHDKPCYVNLFTDNFHRALKKAGIVLNGRKIDFHSLRHYVATMWADKTGDLRQVAKVTGHKDMKMAERYSDHIEEEAIAEMGKTAALILQFKQGA